MMDEMYRLRLRLPGSVVGLAAVGALALAACPAAATEKPVKISFVQALTAGEWNTEITAGAQAAVKDLGFPVDIRVVGPSSFDPSKQAAIFQNETRTSPDAIIVTNVAAPLFVEPALDAEKRGIKIVWINSAPTAEFANDLLVAADPKVMGRLAAKMIAGALEQKQGKPASQIQGEAVMGLCVPGLMTLENRILGTRAELSHLMPKVKGLPTIETKPDRDRNFVAWNQVVRKNPSALIYLDGCEAGQQNIAKIIEDDKLTAVSVGYDTPEEIRDAVKRGIIPGATPSNFYLQAYFAVKLTAQAIHEGKPLPKGWLQITPPVIDASNVQAYIDGWKDPVTGLRSFYGPEIEAIARDATAGKFVSNTEYDVPAQ